MTFEKIKQIYLSRKKKEINHNFVNWKLKLQLNDTTKNIFYYLLSTDNDDDFLNVGDDISRDRIIVEYGEIDKAYIFRNIPESDKVKNFSKIFNDLKKLFSKWFKENKK